MIYLYRSLLTLFIITSTFVEASYGEVVVDSYEQITAVRISRTHYQYTYKIHITNTGEALTNLRATVSSTTSATTIIENELTFGDVPASATAVSEDTIEFQHNRTVAFDTSALVYEFTYDQPTETDNDQDGVSVESGDCDDANPAVYPGAEDIPNNGIDEDCDGEDTIDLTLLDQDNDGYTPLSGDCDDSDPLINPSATDIPNNGIDENCDGVDIIDVSLLDQDLDGFTPALGDCDDSNASINPGATDIPGNGIDEDCDGSDAIVVSDPPQIEITAPLDGVIVYEALILVSGNISDDGEVTAVDVNGTAATITEGAYSVSLTLVPGQNTVLATATDNTGNTATATITVTYQANRPPIIDSITPRSLEIGVPLTLFIGAEDPDGDDLTFNVAPVPEGAIITSVSPSSARFVWTPTTNQVGLKTLTFSVTDGEATASTVVELDVLSANIPPVISSQPTVNAQETTPYAYQLVASDADNDPLSFTLVSAPAGMMINEHSGLINWTPGAYQSGLRDVIVQVDDGRGGSDTQEFTIIVTTEVDRVSPIVSIQAPTSATMGSPVDIHVTAEDNNAVSQVDIQIDGASVAVFNTPPYTVTYNAPPNPGELLSIVARAYDIAGNMGEAQAETLAVEDPDTTAPVFEALLLPPTAATGETITARALVYDDRGIANVALSADVLGDLGEDSVAPYEFAISIPEDIEPGSTFTVEGIATDAEGNTAQLTNSLTVVSQADTEAPNPVTVIAPAEATGAQTIHLSASAVDNVGVLKVAFIVNGVLIGDDADAPYVSEFQIPTDQPLGTQYEIVAQAVDFAGNEAVSAPVVTEIISAESGFLKLEVFDDSRSQPMSGVTVLVSDPEGNSIAPAPLVTDERGRYQASVISGLANIQISKSGYTTAYRSVQVLPDQLNQVLDVRLTPLATPRQVNPLAGTVLPLSDGFAELVVPAEAFEEAAFLQPTQLSPQSLPAPLPLGWSPLYAVELSPFDLDITAPLQLLFKEPIADDLIAARFDEKTQSWRRVELNRNDLKASIAVPAPGAVALIKPDQLPATPPTPPIGGPLEGVPAIPLPEGIAAEILPNPKIIFLQPDAKSDVSVVLSPEAPLPSGTPIIMQFSETYDKKDSTTFSPDQMRQDFLLYQFQNEYQAQFPATPSLAFDPYELEKGVIKLGAFATGGGVNQSLIGVNGGELFTQEGARVAVPQGAVESLRPMSIRVSSLMDAFDSNSNFELLRSIYIDVGDDPLGLPAKLSFIFEEAQDESAQYLILKPVTLHNQTVLVLVGMGEAEGSEIIVGDSSTGLNISGIRTSGHYFLMKMKEPVAFTTGSVKSNEPNPDTVLVGSDAFYIKGIASPSGIYVVPIPLGDGIVLAEEIYDGRQGFARVKAFEAKNVVVKDIVLSDPILTIASVSPSDGEIEVDSFAKVAIEFSQSIDHESVDQNSLYIEDQQGKIPAELSILGNHRTVVISPLEVFQDSQNYTIMATSDIKGVYGQKLNIAGNPGVPYKVASFTVVDNTPPARPDPGKIAISIPLNGAAVVEATTGAFEPNSLVTIYNETTNQSVSSFSSAIGSIKISIFANASDKISIIYSDSSGNSIVVSDIPFTGGNGEKIIGANGGSIQSIGGLVASFRPGSIKNGTQVQLIDVERENFNADFPQSYFLGGFELLFEGQAEEEIDISVPIPDGMQFTDLDTVLVFREIQFGDLVAYELVNTAKIKNGIAKTNSPPFSGVRTNGKYLFIVPPVAVSFVVVGASVASGVVTTTLVGGLGIGFTQLAAFYGFSLPILAVPANAPFEVTSHDVDSQIIERYSFDGFASLEFTKIELGFAGDLALEKSYPSPDSTDAHINSMVTLQFNNAVSTEYGKPKLFEVADCTRDDGPEVKSIPINIQYLPVWRDTDGPVPIPYPVLDQAKKVSIKPLQRLKYGACYKVDLSEVCKFGGYSYIEDRCLTKSNPSHYIFRTSVPEYVGSFDGIQRPETISSIQWDEVVVGHKTNSSKLDDSYSGDSSLSLLKFRLDGPLAGEVFQKLDSVQFPGRIKDLIGIKDLDLVIPPGIHNLPIDRLSKTVLATGGAVSTYSQIRLYDVSNEKISNVGTSFLTSPMSDLYDTNFLRPAKVAKIPLLTGIPVASDLLGNDLAFTATIGVGVQTVRLTDAMDSLLHGENFERPGQLCTSINGDSILDSLFDDCALKSEPMSIGIINNPDIMDDPLLLVGQEDGTAIFDLSEGLVDDISVTRVLNGVSAREIKVFPLYRAVWPQCLIDETLDKCPNRVDPGESESYASDFAVAFILDNNNRVSIFDHLRLKGVSDPVYDVSRIQLQEGSRYFDVDNNHKLLVSTYGSGFEIFDVSSVYDPLVKVGQFDRRLGNTYIDGSAGCIKLESNGLDLYAYLCNPKENSIDVYRMFPKNRLCPAQNVCGEELPVEIKLAREAFKLEKQAEKDSLGNRIKNRAKEFLFAIKTFIGDVSKWFGSVRSLLVRIGESIIDCTKDPASGPPLPPQAKILLCAATLLPDIPEYIEDIEDLVTKGKELINKANELLEKWKELVILYNKYVEFIVEPIPCTFCPSEVLLEIDEEVAKAIEEAREEIVKVEEFKKEIEKRIERLEETKTRLEGSKEKLINSESDVLGEGGDLNELQKELEPNIIIEPQR